MSSGACACDAGLSCGLCLLLVPKEECPREAGYTTLKWHRTSRPPTCAPHLGETMCIGEGECGTDAGARNYEYFSVKINYVRGSKNAAFLAECVFCDER